jgi:hypothetical protein
MPAVTHLEETEARLWDVDMDVAKVIADEVVDAVTEVGHDTDMELLANRH